MQLHHQSCGTGPGVVILHGLFGSSDNWQTFARGLCGSFHVLSIDLPNHGRSPHQPHMDYPSLARQLHGFAQQLKLAPCSVVAHSMGGKVAMQWATTFPADFNKLVVVDIAPKQYAPRHRHILEGLLALNLESYRTRREIENALAPWVPDLAVRRFLLKGVETGAGGRFRWRMGVHNIASNYGALNESISAKSPFTKPALFIRGGSSDYMTEQDMPLVRQFFPNASFRTIPGASHWVHADAPEAFLSIVAEFLGENRS